MTMFFPSCFRISLPVKIMASPWRRRMAPKYVPRRIDATSRRKRRLSLRRKEAKLAKTMISRRDAEKDLESEEAERIHHSDFIFFSATSASLRESLFLANFAPWREMYFHQPRCQRFGSAQ